MEKMREFNPVIGDDLPYFTIALREVPRGYHFRDLVIPPRAVNTNLIKDRLLDYCERHYRNFEIVGVTIGDWFTELQLCVDRNIDNFEKFLAVYDDDIAKPVLGREIVRTHTEDETGDNTGTAISKNYDLPIDNPNGQEIDRITQDNNGTSKRKLEVKDVDIWSDVGVTDNWDKLNGFLNNNPTLEMEFSTYFKDCFTIFEGLKW